MGSQSHRKNPLFDETVFGINHPNLFCGTQARAKALQRWIQKNLTSLIRLFHITRPTLALFCPCAAVRGHARAHCNIKTIDNSYLVLLIILNRYDFTKPQKSGYLALNDGAWLINQLCVSQLQGQRRKKIQKISKFVPPSTFFKRHF